MGLISVSNKCTEQKNGKGKHVYNAEIVEYLSGKKKLSWLTVIPN